MKGRFDPILGGLDAKKLAHVEDQLSNNDVASDEELEELFIENGLTEEQAKRALTYRDRYLLNIYEQGSSPILVGNDARRFNPHTGEFEREDTSERPLPRGKK